MITNNPWKGVVPYTDDPEDLRQHPFRGRDKAIVELLTLISNNEITTLYGRSGIGKTSLLHAGLFPQLNAHNGYPVSIRLYNDCADRHYARHIVKRLSLVAQGENEGSDLQGNDAEIQYLWEFFAYHWFIHQGNEVIPIIVLDQFEEILRNTPDEAVLLLRQLREAKQESYRADGTRFEVNFRLVISIREDDLYLLENALDLHFIDKMKTGRYRLSPIDDEASKEIIFIRDGLYGNISESEKNTIADKLLSLTKQDGAISSIMLSLVCSMAYNLAEGKTINLRTIEKLGDAPIVSFYKECIQGLPNRFVDYIEDKFVDIDRRRTVLESRIPQEYIEYVHQLADENSNHRLLTVASLQNVKEPAYELLHDKLADAISKYHDERLANNARLSRNKKIQRWATAFGLCLLFFASSYEIIKITSKPRIYLYEGDLEGNDVKVMTEGYFVADSFLRLSGCNVPEYTFYGNREVRKIELDDVSYKLTSLYLPEADTLIIGSRQYNQELKLASFPNITTIIAERPVVEISRWNGIRIPQLDTVVVADKDTDYVIWDWKAKVLYGRKSPEDPYEPYVWRYSKKFHTIKDLNSDTPFLVDVDIANLSEWKYDGNTKFRLINTDSSRHVLRKGDIPKMILSNTLMVNIQYIDTLMDSVFYYCSFTDLLLPDTRYIAKHAFLDANVEDIHLPNVRVIADSALYNCWFETLTLEKADSLGKYAVSTDHYYWHAKRIELPVVTYMDTEAFYNRVDKNTFLSYNSALNLSSSQKKVIFGDDDYYNHSTFEWAGEKESKIGYHRQNDTLVIDSVNVNLFIEDTVKVIKAKNTVIVSDIETDNYSFFTWRDNLYKRNKTHEKISLILRENHEVVVSCPYGIADSIIKGNSIDKCKKYICLNRNDIASFSKMANVKDIDLYVPYGQLDYYYAYQKVFKAVYQLSWIETLYYQIFDSYTAVKLKSNILGCLSKSHEMITESDIIFASISITLMILVLIIFIRMNSYSFAWRRDIPIMITIWVMLLLLMQPSCLNVTTIAYLTSDGHIFHRIGSLIKYLNQSDAVFYRIDLLMWPAALFSIILWIGYLCIMKRIQMKKASVKPKLANEDTGQVPVTR